MMSKMRQERGSVYPVRMGRDFDLWSPGDGHGYCIGRISRTKDGARCNTTILSRINDEEVAVNVLLALESHSWTSQGYDLFVPERAAAQKWDRATLQNEANEAKAEVIGHAFEKTLDGVALTRDARESILRAFGDALRRISNV